MISPITNPTDQFQTKHERKLHIKHQLDSTVQNRDQNVLLQTIGRGLTRIGVLILGKILIFPSSKFDPHRSELRLMSHKWTP